MPRKDNCFHVYGDWAWSASKLCYYHRCKKCGFHEWQHTPVPEGETCG